MRIRYIVRIVQNLHINIILLFRFARGFKKANIGIKSFCTHLNQMREKEASATPEE